MMMTRFLVSLACAAVAASAASATDAAQAAPSPPVNKGYDWALRINEGRVSDAILAYEVDGTDDQPLSLQCEEGGRRIFAGISGGPADLRDLTLASGDQRLSVPGKSTATEIDEMPYFTSQEIAADSALIAAFAARGWLRMTVGGHSIDMVATRKGRDAIRRFVAFCTAR
ncbi:MAG: hypothetical protein U0S50_06045 [Sphingopyxis sp.]|uniref:hypothetical protein n=1 Tax=Sphingopyxis sp. TaxID=1908224 RepID=UPI002ABCA268|nr:hypothetical protein [Sphingopyxis sp.]MDZ3831363.1 hypothetical protein [Sphingopyxis sp.]